MRCSSYTANLAAFLTIEKAVNPFKDVTELANSKGIFYGSYASGSTKKFFEARLSLMNTAHIL